MVKTSKLLKLIQFDKSVLGSKKDHCLIGVDEVGRGALAGPVIACAFYWKVNIDEILIKYKKMFKELNDSKQLSFLERKKMYLSLCKLGNFSTGYASVKEIEELNVLNATFLAMKRAFDGLKTLNNNFENFTPYLLIDGNKFNPFINAKQISVIDGDAKSSLIAAASIVAKVYRDDLMTRLSNHTNYKHFVWDKNVGYGTLLHRKAIRKYGLTPLHRKLFVRKTLDEANSF